MLSRSRLFVGGFLLLLLVGTPLTARSKGAKPRPPAGRTYFTIFYGVRSPVSFDAACVEFSSDEACFNGFCGRWQPRPASSPFAPETPFSLELVTAQFGLTFTTFIDASGFVARAGKRSAIGGAGLAQPNSIRAAPNNFSFSGRAASPRRCAKLLAAFVPPKAVASGR